MIRIAAVGDVHFGWDAAGSLRPHLQHLSERADLFLVAGDITRVGNPDEAVAFVRELDELSVPTLAVLGNHDFEMNREAEIRRVLERAGIQVLEGDGTVLDVNGVRVGIAGAKGFGGGFVGACGSDFGEPEMKAFIRHTKGIAERLEHGLGGLDADVRVALLHYAPIEATLSGERLEIYPFLGSYLLAEAIDRTKPDLVLHGHAHRGAEHGVTPGGVPVRNVAQPVIRQAYGLYCLPDPHDELVVHGAAERPSHRTG